MIKAHFENIRSFIIEELSNANKSLKIAVYWFTNQELFNIICHKQLEGVRCELVVHNDYINNRASGLPFQKFIDAGGRFYFSDNRNPMHNKFCIIDGLVLINGSYNWTYYAEDRNKENVLVIRNEVNLIKSFEQEFNNIIGSLEPINQVNFLSKYELDVNDSLQSKAYLAYDLIYKAKQSNSIETLNLAFEIDPNNLGIQKVATDLGLIKKSTLNSSLWVSVVNDGVKLVALKGSAVPATFSTTLRTAIDNQSKGTTDVLFGDNARASENQKLASITLEDLPPGQAGKVELKFSFSIDIEGNIQMELLSLNCGKRQIGSKKAVWLISSEGF
jgi:hypothetical protein